MVLYPILLSQSWSTTVPNFMLVSVIAQSGQNLALFRLAIMDFQLGFFFSKKMLTHFSYLYTVKPRKFELLFSKYPLIRNKLGHTDRTVTYSQTDLKAVNNYMLRK